MPERRSNSVETNIHTKQVGISNRDDNGVSVILCTNRTQFLPNIFSNYARQLYKTKELILVLNNNKMDLNKYRVIAGKYQNVAVYKMDETVSLGRCLNFAVSKAKYSIVAKLDDDDYYSPYYLNGVVRCLNASKADVIGKNTCYLYLKSRNLLLLFHPDRANQHTDMVMGSTLAFRRRIFNKVKFRDVTLGEDTYFFSDCNKHKVKIYSCDPFNYVCIRRRNRFSHTWSIDENTILEHSVRITKTKNFIRYITRVV